MKYLILFFAFVLAVGGNPALVTSNTYPGSSSSGQYQYQNQYPNQQQQQGYPTQQQQQGYPNQQQQQGYYRRPVYRDGMITPVNYTPYLRTRNVNPQEQEMRILPYPSQYTAQNRNNNMQTQEMNKPNSNPRPIPANY
uniref:Uncharacterized protein n=1 Tax=Panagrolaimus sp. ES5 TaxID=591445 RepID=A0AC34F758_9BILA